MSKEIIEFYAEDGAILNGYINTGREKTDKVLIETHGMSSNGIKKREKIIANKIEEIGIDTICFSNRGNGIVNFVKYKDGRRELGGTAYENVEDSYYDVLGAINYAVSLGYTKIYLQGHSLGATKMVYTYNRMKKANNANLKYIKAILLLSFVDVSAVFKMFATPEIIDFARNKAKENKELELMPVNTFLSPISVKNYLSYIEMKDKIDELEMLNNVDIPLFMRWGNVRELIEKKADEHAKFMNENINNANKDISYIDGANHSYDGKENILADEICEFLRRI